MDAYLKDVRHVECFYDTHVKTPPLPHFLTVKDGNFVIKGKGEGGVVEAAEGRCH